MFAFADSQLEGLYQAGLASRICFYAWNYCTMNLIIGWTALLMKLLLAPVAVQDLRPPYLLPALGNLLPSLAVVLLGPIWPSMFEKHWRVINVAVSIFQISAWNHLRPVMLWQQLQLVESSVPGLPQSAIQFKGTSFLIENWYLTCMSLRVAVFPSGFASDILLTSFAFVFTMLGNPGVCKSPQWTAIPTRLSLSDGHLQMIRTASAGMWAILGDPGSSPGLDAIFQSTAHLSCPAVLAFWEVVGWWLTTLFVMVREVLSRRAFLKANVSLLGNGGSRKALLWPLGTVEMLQMCVTAILFTTFMAFILWALALLAFN
eukprot:jgi/Botrbrau1/511/Bobra.110_2s0140.1